MYICVCACVCVACLALHGLQSSCVCTHTQTQKYAHTHLHTRAYTHKNTHTTHANKNTPVDFWVEASAFWGVALGKQTGVQGWLCLACVHPVFKRMHKRMAFIDIVTLCVTQSRAEQTALQGWLGLCPPCDVER